jgi:hypothetical protein
MSIVSAVAASGPYVDADAFELAREYYYLELWTSTPWTIPKSAKQETSGLKRFTVDVLHRGELLTDSTGERAGTSSTPHQNTTLCVRDSSAPEPPPASEVNP